MAGPADDDARRAVGPLLRTLVGTPSRRTWLRRLVGAPALLLRWIATRSATEYTVRRAPSPSTAAPGLTDFVGVQAPSSGAGPGIHRTYAVTVAGAAGQAAAAIHRLATEPNLHCTIELGSFESDDAIEEVRLDVGRDLVVELAGPFDGPVRVVEREERMIRLQTREGHIESGQIVFETIQRGDDLEFVISSWARSRDQVVDMLFRTGPARWLQQHMWISVCRQVAKGAGADAPLVDVTTEWLPPEVDLLGEVLDDGTRT